MASTTTTRDRRAGGTSAPVRGAEVRDSGVVTDVLHGDDRVELRVEQLVLPGDGDDPPLAIERSVRPGGPRRPPVLLVHGLAQNRFTWRISGRSMSGALAAAGYDVLNLELRGHGNSRQEGAGNATAFDQYVRDVARVAARCGEPPFLIGHSLGAAACLGAATEAPVRGLIHLAGVYRFAAHNRTLRALARLSLGLEPVLMRAPVRMSTGWAGDLLGRLYAITDIAGYGAPIAGWVPDSIERDLLAERLALGFDWTSVEVWLQMSRWACGEPLQWAEPFCALDLPLLVMVGDHDPLVRPRDVDALMRDSCSTDRQLLVMEPFEHRVHWGHLDLILGRHAPEETWPRIVAWLDAR